MWDTSDMYKVVLYDVISLTNIIYEKTCLNKY